VAGEVKGSSHLGSYPDEEWDEEKCDDPKEVVAKKRKRLFGGVSRKRLWDKAM